MRASRSKAGEKAGAGAAPAAGGARGLGTHAGARSLPLRPPLAVGGFAPGGGPWPAPDSSKPSALRFWLINGAVLGRAARTAWHAGPAAARGLRAASPAGGVRTSKSHAPLRREQPTATCPPSARCCC